MNVGNNGGQNPTQPSRALATRPNRNQQAAPAIPYSEIKQSRCKVCNSPYRREIDMCLVTGWSQSSVMRHFNQVAGEEAFNKMNISRHARYHLDAKDAAVRRIIETRAKQFLTDVDEIEGSILTRASALDILIQRGMEGVNQGTVELKAQDIITAIDRLDKLEADYKDTAIDEMLVEFRAFAEVVKDSVGEDKFRDIWDAFEIKMDAKVRPAINPLDSGANADEIEGDLVDEETE